jgi:hypothetical protein
MAGVVKAKARQAFEDTIDDARRLLPLAKILQNATDAVYIWPNNVTRAERFGSTSPATRSRPYIWIVPSSSHPSSVTRTL